MDQTLTAVFQQIRVVSEPSLDEIQLVDSVPNLGGP